MSDKIKILAIESSCDETAAAVVENGRCVRSNIISSQIELHKLYGGVVPEIASRKHVEKVNFVVREALKEAGETLDSIDAIAVTYGPGLVGALLVGVAEAKALAFAKNKPLVGVHHIEGHICANYIEHPDLEPPFLCLVVSGGHTHLVDVKDYGKYEIIGCTRDDAAGEAFDKVARAIGLGYPGGPKIEALAREGNKDAIAFPRAKVSDSKMDFSFSGLKSAVINLVHNEEQIGNEINKEDLACSFQDAVVEELSSKTIRAVKKYKVNNLILAGGVAANKGIREKLTKLSLENGINFSYPSMKYCTDNATMIATAGYFCYKLKNDDWYNLILNGVSSEKLS